MKYMLLFIGGNIPESKKKQGIEDRLTWMNDLRSRGKFVDGSPLKSSGKTIDHKVVMQFTHDSDSINGYAVLDVKGINEAVAIAGTAPQLKPGYGSARVEIRPLLPLL